MNVLMDVLEVVGIAVGTLISLSSMGLSLNVVAGAVRSAASAVVDIIDMVTCPKRRLVLV